MQRTTVIFSRRKEKCNCTDDVIAKKRKKIRGEIDLFQKIIPVYINETQYYRDKHEKNIVNATSESEHEYECLKIKGLKEVLEPRKCRHFNILHYFKSAINDFEKAFSWSVTDDKKFGKDIDYFYGNIITFRKSFEILVDEVKKFNVIYKKEKKLKLKDMKKEKRCAKERMPPPTGTVFTTFFLFDQFHAMLERLQECLIDLEGELTDTQAAKQPILPVVLPKHV